MKVKVPRFTKKVELGEIEPLHPVLAFVVEVAETIFNKIKDFIVGLWNNWEGAVILTAAVSGLVYQLGELPFMFMLPMWVEGPMVVPAAAVIIVLLLLKNAKRREAKRFAKVMS